MQSIRGKTCLWQTKASSRIWTVLSPTCLPSQGLSPTQRLDLTASTNKQLANSTHQHQHRSNVLNKLEAPRHFSSSPAQVLHSRTIVCGPLDWQLRWTTRCQVSRGGVTTDGKTPAQVCLWTRQLGTLPSFGTFKDCRILPGNLSHCSIVDCMYTAVGLLWPLVHHVID